MNAPDTPALEQADQMENLAAHMRAHPHLKSVIVWPGNWLQLLGSDNPARALLDWASTMTGPLRVQSRLQGDGVYVAVTGGVGDRVELVWNTLSGFAEYLSDVEAAAPTPDLSDLDLDLLRGFAEACDRAKRWLAGLDTAEVGA